MVCPPCEATLLQQRATRVELLQRQWLSSLPWSYSVVGPRPASRGRLQEVTRQNQKAIDQRQANNAEWDASIPNELC